VVPAALRPGELALGIVAAGEVRHVVALGLQLRGVAQQDRDRGQEYRGRLAAPPGPDEPAHHLREEQRGAHARGEHPDGQARDVHPLGDHADGDHPPVAGRGERGDLLAGRGIIGNTTTGRVPVTRRSSAA
jgi:hypothetical protein